MTRAEQRDDAHQAADLGFSIGAGDENRTRTISLGSLDRDMTLTRQDVDLRHFAPFRCE
jgi:hypothetical protein